MPTNISAGTATALGALPADISQDVTTAGAAVPVWFSYTAGPTDVTISVLALAVSGTNYRPSTTVWLGPSGAPVQYLPALPLQAGHDTPMVIPVSNGVIYYIKVEPDGFSIDPPGSNLRFRAFANPTTAVAAGDLLIPDDTDPLPAIVLDPTTGDAKRYQRMTVGEEGDILTTGYVALSNDDVLTDPHRIYIYDPTLTLVTFTAVNAGNTQISIRGDSTKFFFSENVIGNPDSLVRTISTAGVIGGTSWAITGKKISTIAPNRTGTILYYSEGNVGNPIKRWDLVNNIALSDLVAAPASHFADKDLYVLADDTILVTWTNSGVDYSIRNYATDGTLLHTFAFTPAGTRTDGPRVALGSDDPLSFWVWATGTVAGDFVSRFKHFRVSDGATIATFDVFVFESAIGPAGTGNQATLQQFGNSKSCPFMVMRAANVIPTTATLTVQKITLPITDPTASFDFTGTGAGVTPSFSLVGGASVVFSALVPGTYGVAETGLPFGWVALSHTVSNGDPINAIVLVAGDDVTVTFYNRDTNAAPAVFRRLETRRMRRAPHLNADHTRMVFNSFELLAQVGVGLSEGQGSDPVMLMRYSDDGGWTWSEYKRTSLGALGAYRTRVRWTRLGQARDRVFEVVVSDPVDCSLVNAYVDASKGTS